MRYCCNVTTPEFGSRFDINISSCCSGPEEEGLVGREGMGMQDVRRRAWRIPRAAARCVSAKVRRLSSGASELVLHTVSLYACRAVLAI